MLLLLLGAASAQDTLRVHFLDQGQGEATLIEAPCGAILVDTGGEDPLQYNGNVSLTRDLDAFFERRPDLEDELDLVVLTHPHLDHTRNLPTLLERYRVALLVDNGRSDDRDSGGLEQIYGQQFVQRCERWQKKDCPIEHESLLFEGLAEVEPVELELPRAQACEVELTVTALWGGVAGQTWDKGNQNSHSVVLRVDYGDSSVLFTGDLQEEGIAAMLGHYPDGELDVDLYQVGHHGSHNATTRELLVAMSPKLAVVSMGPPDRPGRFSAYNFGHPRAPVVRCLDAHTSLGTPGTRQVQVGTKMRTFEPATVQGAVFSPAWSQVPLVALTDGDGQWAIEGLSLTTNPRFDDSVSCQD